MAEEIVRSCLGFEYGSAYDWSDEALINRRKSLRIAMKALKAEDKKVKVEMAKRAAKKAKTERFNKRHEMIMNAITDKPIPECSICEEMSLFFYMRDDGKWFCEDCGQTVLTPAELEEAYQ